MIYSNSFDLINNKMKKIIFSFVSAVSLVFVAESVTYMRVNTTDGKTVLYEVNNVETVDFFEAPNDTVVDGVSVSGYLDNYAYVDLGLKSGAKWATYNVGATKPIEKGDYYAWGEVETKDNYYWDTYKWIDEGDYRTMKKYCIHSDFGVVDGNKILDAEDDVVTVTWGKEWRMPTHEEQVELAESCDWEWTDNFNGSGISGNVGTSKINGNTIFFPTTGYCYDRMKSNTSGYYWSSTVYESYSDAAYTLEFETDAVKSEAANSRYYGMVVRAVSGPLVEKKLYKVSFYRADSSLILCKSVEEGKSAGNINAPSLAGYDFVGWSDSSFTEVHSNLDIYAQYVPEYIPDSVTVSGKVAGYDYVDMGLESGTLWATYNVGAKAPTGYGDFYAWGETEVKEKYVMSNYKAKERYSENSGDTVLVASDDAVTVNWGDNWRLPTREEFLELARECEWKIASDFGGSGVAGLVGISKKNKNVIFLPFCGYAKATVEAEGTAATYWTSTYGYDGTSAYDATSYHARISNSIRMVQVNRAAQEMGRNVRGVVNK